MLISRIDYNLIADVVRIKESVKQSVEGVMDGSLTASHLASNVYELLDVVDKMEIAWRSTPPTEETVPAGEVQPQQPAPAEAAPAEEVQSEQPAPAGGENEKVGK